ncbi:MAG: putative domain endonuclease, putative endonuclease [Candidatus Berkelbacteria bacterium]|nr:putative domain endonuclease, putative endonuclease [Candidatus Berkelbacteria bacterium]
MYYIYVLRSKKDQSLYIGYTANLKQRISDHNKGQSYFTKRKIPYEFIYGEIYIDKRDAKGREKFLKSGAGWRFLKKQIKYILEP